MSAPEDITPTGGETEFDRPAYQAITRSEYRWLDRQMPIVVQLVQPASAIEYGCGVGVFTRALLERGIAVLGLDLQEGNLAEARRRHPQAEYRQLDFDGCSEADFEALPRADLGFAFGVLYHLENPLGTIRRIGERSSRAVMISTRVAEGHPASLHLHEELVGAAHNYRRVTAVPTLSAVVTALGLSGFDHVYRPDDQPDHAQWTDAFRNGRRHSLIAFREPVDVDGWKQVAGRITKKWEPVFRQSAPPAVKSPAPGDGVGAIPRAKRVIAVAGMPRSGSTLMYNLARLALERAGHKVHGVWIEDFAADRIGTADTVLVKVHRSHPALLERADVVLTSRRDLRDIARSLVQMKFAPTLDIAVERLPAQIADHAFWAGKAALDIRYEDLLERGSEAVRTLCAALGLNLADAEMAALWQDANALPEPGVGRYDGVTLLHPRHRAGGGHAQGWKSELPATLVRAIEDRHGDWLTRNGYPIAATVAV